MSCDCQDTKQTYTIKVTGIKSNQVFMWQKWWCFGVHERSTEKASNSSICKGGTDIDVHSILYGYCHIRHVVCSIHLLGRWRSNIHSNTAEERVERCKRRGGEMCKRRFWCLLCILGFISWAGALFTFLLVPLPLLFVLPRRLFEPFNQKLGQTDVL